jgi:hypothetical protein
VTGRAVLALAAFSLVPALAGAEPRGHFAPKAHPPLRHAAGPNVTTPYFYVSYGQEATTAGAGGMLYQADPAVASVDFHSLGEIAVESADEKEIIEIGWNVDEGVNSDLEPHLFAFHWINGVGTCYDGCDFTQVSATRMPGMRVTPGEVDEYGIAYANGNWNLYYQGELIGYFAGSLWSPAYTTAGLVQWFGEVSAGSEMPCTQMGNGTLGTGSGAASMTGLYLIDAGGAHEPATIEQIALTAPTAYLDGAVTTDGFSFGGPGFAATASCCQPKSCAQLGVECGETMSDGCGSMAACGQCQGGGTCSPTFQCPAEAAADVTLSGADDPVPGSHGGGCCEASREPPLGAALLALGVIVPLVRRRRR